MNLIKILYEPYVIIIFLSLLITLITYFIIRNKNNEDDGEKISVPKTLLYTFVISFLVIMILKYAIKYMNDKNFFQKGGVNIRNVVDNLTIVADDVDYGIFED